MICGYPAKQIRDILFYVKGVNFDEHIMDRFKIPRHRALDLIKRLFSEGYIEKSEDSEGTNSWITTIRGNALALASAAKPVKRVTAEKALQEFLLRAKRVNTDPYYLYYVEKVIVFGSYLSDCPTLNDVDLAIKLKSKFNDNKERVKNENIRIKEAYRKGRVFGNIVDRLYWPYIEVIYFLKSRSRTISLHPIDDDILENAKKKILYQREQGKQVGGYSEN